VVSCMAPAVPCLCSCPTPVLTAKLKGTRSLLPGSNEMTEFEVSAQVCDCKGDPMHSVLQAREPGWEAGDSTCHTLST
jgi:hypothetical protein